MSGSISRVPTADSPSGYRQCGQKQFQSYCLFCLIIAPRAVNAVAQSRALAALLPYLTAEEIAIVKRGRNAHPHHSAPKSASTGEYAGATGLEALLGYLFLIGDFGRLLQLDAWMRQPTAEADAPAAD